MCWENNHISPNNTDTQAYYQMSATALKVLMGGHHLVELDKHGADEDKLTSTFVAACYGSKVDIDMTTHRYQVWKSNIVDPIQYGWQAGDDGTTP